MMCLDRQGYVNFNKIDTLIKKAYKNNLISEATYNTFLNIGLSSMNFNFYVPIKEQYEEIIKKYFIIESIEFTNDVGAKDFPIYILRKK